MAHIIVPGQILPNKMVPTIVSADPTPTGLRVSAYRAPESGYARMVPDTWFRQYSNPSVVDWERIRNANTGWETGGPAIGTGRTVEIFSKYNKSTSSMPFGLVESGLQYPTLGVIQDWFSGDEEAQVDQGDPDWEGGDDPVDPYSTGGVLDDTEEWNVLDVVKNPKGFVEEAKQLCAMKGGIGTGKCYTWKDGECVKTQCKHGPGTPGTTDQNGQPPAQLQGRQGSRALQWAVAGVGIIAAVYIWKKGI